MIRFIDNLDDYIPKNEYSSFVKEYYKDIIKFGTKKYISNIDSEIKIIDLNGTIIPISIGNSKKNNCYTTSILGSLDYAYEEINKNKIIFVRNIQKYFIKILYFILSKLDIDENIYVGNFLLSTNILPDLDRNDIKELKEFLSQNFKGKCIIFRSINNKITYSLKKNLEEESFKKISSRQIFIFRKENIENILALKHNIEDKKLIEKSNIKFIKCKGNLSLKKIKNIKKCYDELYIKKYTKLNPNFTIDFFKKILKNDFFNINGVCINNEVLAIYGYYTINNISTTPIFGYILDKNKKFGLYRIITYKTIKETLNKSSFLNHSSGAGKFKLNRGAEFDIEYLYYYEKKCPIKQKIAWKILEIISKYFIETNLKNNIY